jgi:hypothetical protein
MTRVGPTAPLTRNARKLRRGILATSRIDRPSTQYGANRAVLSQYFAAVHDTFRRAGQAVASFVDRDYVIGGYNVRLRFIGSTLIPRITPAVGHLEAPAPHVAPALTICLWDSASTGATPPAPAWEASGLESIRGEVVGYNDERFSTAIFNNLGRNTLSVLDRESNLALFWVPDEQALPMWEIGGPLRSILHWWMGDHGRRMVHAGAVGTPSGGVLLAGRGGVGKSTTTLSCLLSGLLYLGDDYVLLSAESGPSVHSLYSSAKLSHDSFRWFPQLLPAVSSQPGAEDEEKALLLLRDHFGDQIVTSLPLCATLIPRVTGLARTRLKRASAAASLMALAPSTIFQLPSGGRAVFQQIAQVIEQVPSYFLELGRDVHEVPRVILQLLSELGDDDVIQSGRGECSS